MDIQCFNINHANRNYCHCRQLVYPTLFTNFSRPRPSRARAGPHAMGNGVTADARRPTQRAGWWMRVARSHPTAARSAVTDPCFGVPGAREGSGAPKNILVREKRQSPRKRGCAGKPSHRKSSFLQKRARPSPLSPHKDRDRERGTFCASHGHGRCCRCSRRP